MTRLSGIHCFFLFIFALMFSCTTGCRPLIGEKEAPLSFDGLKTCLDKPMFSMEPGEKERCISLLEQFSDAHPTDPGADQVALQLGRFYMERGDFSSAYSLFTLFPDQYPKSQRYQDARLYLGICLFYLDKTRDSLNLLHAMAQDPEAARLLKDVSRYIAENYLKFDNFLTALTWFSRVEPLIKEASEKNKLYERVLQVVVSQGWEPEVMQKATILFPDGFFAEAVQLGIAASRYHHKQPRLAESQLVKLSERHPDDIFTTHIQALRERLYAEGTHSVCTVGCLLPLSGKYGRLGNSVLEALLLGARAFEDHEEKGNIRLLSRDTQGVPAEAVKRLRELAAEEDLIGIVGPLLATVAHACAQEAQTLSVPMITLTQREDVARVGDYIFQNGLTARQQVNALVEYTMENLGISSFAILYPDHVYGTRAQDLFTRRVLEMGGDVLSAVSYGEKETDFQEEIGNLVGHEYITEMQRREEERKKINIFKEKNKNRSMMPDDPSISQPGENWEEMVSEKMEEPLLPPFEALFVPDNYRKVSLIAPHLALFDLEEIILLGTSAWNSDNLVEQAGEYVRNAIFVDGFFAKSAMPHVKDFVEEFMRDFLREPRVFEAQGYDSLLILEQAFLNAMSSDRSRIREELVRMKGYPGLSGSTSFDEDGCAAKQLYLLTVRQNQIQQIF